MCGLLVCCYFLSRFLYEKRPGSQRKLFLFWNIMCNILDFKHQLHDGPSMGHENVIYIHKDYVVRILKSKTMLNSMIDLR